MNKLAELKQNVSKTNLIRTIKVDVDRRSRSEIVPSLPHEYSGFTAGSQHGADSLDEPSDILGGVQLVQLDVRARLDGAGVVLLLHFTSL